VSQTSGAAGDPAALLRFLELHIECALSAAFRRARKAGGVHGGRFAGTIVRWNQEFKIFVAHASSDGSFTDM
jgi:hypothetical protein